MSKDFVEQEKRGSQTFQQTIANVNLRLAAVVTGVKKKLDDATETVAEFRTRLDDQGQPITAKVDTIIETMLTRQKGTPLNAEELIAGRITLQLINNETTRLVKQVQAGQGDEATVKKMSQMIALERIYGEADWRSG